METEDSEFEASLGYIVKLHFKEEEKNLSFLVSSLMHPIFINSLTLSFKLVQTLCHLKSYTVTCKPYLLRKTVFSWVVKVFPSGSQDFSLYVQNVNWYSHHRKQYKVPKEIKIELLCHPESLLLLHNPKEWNLALHRLSPMLSAAGFKQPTGGTT